MKIRDRNIKQTVDVRCGDCIQYKCYWPRPDPGVFTQGQGYRKSVIGDRGWLCGNREVRGCPINPETKTEIKPVIEEHSNLISDCGCRFESNQSNAVLLCEKCGELPCHNR